jgi:myo-inositol 2-dehydrogenase/D-chiro-inositol 1-dehydrogenase
VLAGREKLRTTIDDGVKALELADAATTSWKEGRIVKLG